MIGRARFGRDIIAEFAVPLRKSTKVVLFCSGLPSSPSKRALLEFFADKGYWAFALRYRGTWESEGVFLKQSPEVDVHAVVDGVMRGFVDVWSGKKFVVHNARVSVVGSSFGGTAALFASGDPRVKGVVALSPVVDWTLQSKAEPLEKMRAYLRNGFGPAYRVDPGAWKKLQRGDFFNPAHDVECFDGRKIFIVHAQDDEIIGWRPVAHFAKQCGARLLMLKKGGHLSGNALLVPALYKHVAKFLKTVYT
jgi:pimeloyl-ACP methyl ester carboxylesterase